MRAWSACIVPPSASIERASTPIASRRRQPSATPGLPVATSSARAESRSTGRTISRQLRAPKPITSSSPAPSPASSTSRRPEASASPRSSSTKRRCSTAAARPRPSMIGNASCALEPLRL